MRHVLAVIVALVAAAPAQADGAPGIPFSKSVHAIHRIETQEQHPNYVFVLYREGLQYDAVKKEFEWYHEADFIDLTRDLPLVLDLVWTPIEQPADKQRTRESAELMIVPRNIATSYQTAMDLYRAPQAQIPDGAVRRQRFDARVLVPSWVGDEITITHRVQRATSGDGLELVRTSGNPLRQWYAAAGFVTVAVVIGGVWIIRRLRSPRLATTK